MTPGLLDAVFSVTAPVDCATCGWDRAGTSTSRRIQGGGAPTQTCTENGLTAYKFSLAPGSGMHDHVGC